jgi:hypothetical protein
MKADPLADKEIEIIISAIYPDSIESDFVKSKLIELIILFIKRGEKMSQRLQGAILKCSSGNLKKFDKAISMADHDWRDVLVGAGFGLDVNKHERWIKNTNEQKTKK